MQVSDPNNVKIYNLSAGKSLPEVTYNLRLFIIKVFIQNIFNSTTITKMQQHSCSFKIK